MLLRAAHLPVEEVDRGTPVETRSAEFARRASPGVDRMVRCRTPPGGVARHGRRVRRRALAGQQPASADRGVTADGDEHHGCRRTARTDGSHHDCTDDGADPRGRRRGQSRCLRTEARGSGSRRDRRGGRSDRIGRLERREPGSGGCRCHPSLRSRRRRGRAGGRDRRLGSGSRAGRGGARRRQPRDAG